MTDNRYADFWGPHHGAVSLTFDDGCPCQLQHAIPMMDDLNLKGTFYLSVPRDDWAQRLAPWVEPAASGHEIGGHGMMHYGSNNFYDRTGGIEDI